MNSFHNVRRGMPVAAGAMLLAFFSTSPLLADDQALARLNDPAQQQQPERVVVEGRKSTDSDYTLGPGDKVRVTVYDEDDLSGEFQIDSAGYVRLPLIGQVRAAGHSVFQLESQVESALDDGYLRNARVNIEVTAYRPFYIIGEVNKPGEYPYVSNMTVVNAVALAGGYTMKAVVSTIFVRHESEIREHPIALTQLTKLYPGDVLRVPETSFWTSADILSPITQVLAPVTSLAYVLKP